MNNPVVIINGVQYDPVTGLRLSAESAPREEETTAPRKTTSALHVHKKLERTKTLSRSHVKAPARPPAHSSVSKHHTKSPMIHKFAPVAKQKTEPNAPSSSRGKVISDIGPVRHPIQHKVAAIKTAKEAQAVSHTQSAQATKEQVIAKALHAAEPKKSKKHSFVERRSRFLSTSTASLAIILLAGYLTYINLPNISVRVAAIQAGIAANYPSYQPSGYSLNGPVAYSNGRVSMQFAANVGPQNFSVNQSKTTWDSSALLENYVQPSSNGQYETLSDGGLTIYVFDSSASWVNAGILYTIEGDAPLTQDQIRKIATSM